MWIPARRTARPDRCRKPARGSGVLEVCPADLDDVVEDPGLRLQRLVELPQRRLQVGLERLEGGEVHRGGDHVVGRLAEIDVVVGMDRGLRADLPAEYLDCPV